MISHQEASSVKPTPVSGSAVPEAMENNESQPPRRGPKDFIFGRVLGEGSFSTVYMAKDIQTSKEFAIKVCEKRHIIKERKQQYVQREKEVLKLLSSSITSSSPFFVRLYCTFQDQDSLYFVLTLAPCGDLLTYLQKNGGKFSLEVARFYVAEIVQAVEYMHLQGVIHRDLKPENILLSAEKHILVTDFGSAKILPRPPLVQENEESVDGKPQRRRSFVGTAQYVSPEVLTDKSSSMASDLWAIGCIIFQMLSGEPPFQAKYNRKILKLDFGFTEAFTPAAKDLIANLLVIEANQRLGALDVGGHPSLKKHEFFREIDFDKLYLQTPPVPEGYQEGSEKKLNDPTMFDGAEPGLGGQQLSRLLGLSLEDSPPRENLPEEVKSNKPAASQQPPKRTAVTIPSTPEAVTQKLKQQEQNLPQWHSIVEKRLILKQGLVDKRKGLFSRRRMLLLTTGPRLFYVDPSSMVLKGQIPFGPTLKAEAKNFKNFHVHTPGRTYYLEDPEGFALEWCKALEEVRKHYFEKEQV